LNNTVVWNVKSYSLVDTYQLFKKTCCHHLWPSGSEWLISWCVCQCREVEAPSKVIAKESAMYGMFLYGHVGYKPICK